MVQVRQNQPNGRGEEHGAIGYEIGIADGLTDVRISQPPEVLLLLRQLSRKQYYPPQSCMQEETHSLVAHGRPLKGHAIE
jgi:hypothetical protein